MQTYGLSMYDNSGVFSASNAIDATLLDTLNFDLARDIAGMCDCIPGLPRRLGGIWSRVSRQESALEKAAARTFRITVKMFMDAHTFHEARIRQCCVHTGTFEADPRRYSFCWRWLFEDALDTPEPAIIPLEALTA